MSMRKHATNALSLPIYVLHAYTTRPRSRVTYVPASAQRWTAAANLRVRNHLIRTKMVEWERVHNDYSRKRARLYMHIYIYIYIRIRRGIGR